MSRNLKPMVLSSIAVLVVGITICGVWFVRNGNFESPVGQQAVPSENPLPSGLINNKVNAGDKIVLAISADDVCDMYGYELCVNYNKDILEYSGGLKSDIAEISTIFKSTLNFDSYIKIGATQINGTQGINGSDIGICQMTFTAIQDCELADISISNVNIVTASDEYIKDIMNWSCEVKPV